MGFFDKIFGKKETKIDSEINNSTQLQKGDLLISTDTNGGYKIIRELSNEQKAKIESSIILLRTGQLYMHYWTDHLVCLNRDDPEWQNKVMFFWKAEEPFEKKSLPPIFKDFKVKHFLFQGDTSNISVQSGQAIPWFGMPGLGEKHVCEMNGQKVTIPELYDLGYIDYIKQIELTEENLDILSDKENYYFLIDERITPFIDGNFYLNGKVISISLAYSIGGIHIITKSKLEE